MIELSKYTPIIPEKIVGCKKNLPNLPFSAALGYNVTKRPRMAAKPTVKGENTVIYGIGYDLCQIERMQKSLQRESFCRRVFGRQEWAELQKLGPHRRAESAAACFAAKEAFLKAAGTGLGGFDLAEVQALRKQSGAPYYALTGKAAQWLQAEKLTAHLSLTHEAGLAAAMVILEK